MMVFENKSKTGFEEEVTDGMSEFEDAKMIPEAVLKSYNMIDNQMESLKGFLFKSDPDELRKVAVMMVKKEVEWNMSTAEGEDYDYWLKVYEEVQRQS